MKYKVINRYSYTRELIIEADSVEDAIKQAGNMVDDFERVHDDAWEGQEVEEVDV